MLVYKYKPPEETKIWCGTIVGEEEAWCRGKGGREMDTRPSSGPSGTSRRLRPAGGGGVKEIAEEGHNL